MVGLAFDEKPDYEKCRNILRDGLRARGYKDDGKLVFMSATPVPASRKQKSRPERKVSKRKSEEIEEFENEDSKETKEQPEKKRGKIKPDAKKGLKKQPRGKVQSKEGSPQNEKENMTKARKCNSRTRKAADPEPSLYGLENPTAPMLEIMKKKFGI